MVYIIRPEAYSLQQGTQYQDILAFHHHAGTIVAAVGRYKTALESFFFVSTSQSTYR